MRKLLVCLFLTFVFCNTNLYQLTQIHSVYAQQKPIPPYAKWSIMALKKTEEKYPNAKIIDYLHIGRIRGSRTSTERFKFWLKDNQKEFGVYVNIEFNTETENVINITFKETTS